MPKEIKRLFDFAYYQLENFNLETAFCTKYDNEWVATSTKEFIAKGNAISRGLLKLGVKPGDKIAVIGDDLLVTNKEIVEEAIETNGSKI